MIKAEKLPVIFFACYLITQLIMIFFTVFISLFLFKEMIVVVARLWYGWKTLMMVMVVVLSDYPDENCCTCSNYSNQRLCWY